MHARTRRGAVAETQGDTAGRRSHDARRLAWDARVSFEHHLSLAGEQLFRVHWVVVGPDRLGVRPGTVQSTVGNMARELWS